MKKIWLWLLVENNRKVISFLGTGIAVIVAASWTYFTYFDSSKDKIQTQNIIQDGQDARNIKGAKSNQTAAVKQPNHINRTSFTGVYVGISTEGTAQLPVKITFEHLGDEVTGTYSLSGMLGTMRGTVSGNTFNYEWNLGGYSGLGVSIIQGNMIKGTWGYNNSNNNAGTLTAQLQ